MTPRSLDAHSNGSILKERLGHNQQAGLAAVATQGDQDKLYTRVSVPRELFLWLTLSVFFFGSAISIHIGQWVGTPLYFIKKKAYYAYMALTKRAGALLILTITQWWSPTLARVSGDASVQGQLQLDQKGFVRCAFPKRAVIVANHQIYTDWSYLWWMAYTAGCHDRLYIMLKDSLRWIPVLGIGLRFFGFIYMSRKWASDESRMIHRMQKLNSGYGSSQEHPDSMWLLVFPEGTNLSAKQRAMSAKFAVKSGQADMIHTVLPRSTGLRCCLQSVRDTVDWMYDCTIAYEGIVRGQYSAETFTLRSTYFRGQQPKSVNMYWRRFRISDMPLDDKDAFHAWLTARWREKDQLIEEYINTGRFPAFEYTSESEAQRLDYVQSQVGLKHPLEILRIFLPFGIGMAVIGVVLRLCNRI
ncbi:hypothetical protein LTR66_005744 [Elasticomyces elasticus]|nr:hypothetical protein LTR66_005744 [Elasticomyces elasticus]